MTKKLYHKTAKTAKGFLLGRRPIFLKGKQYLLDLLRSGNFTDNNRRFRARQLDPHRAVTQNRLPKTLNAPGNILDFIIIGFAHPPVKQAGLTV